MKFASSIREGGGPLDLAASNAQTRWQSRAGLVVELSAKGITGVGEASPLPTVSPESLEEARHVLEIAAAMLNLEPTQSASKVLELIDQLVSTELPSAKFALETAALDWLGQRQDVPFHRLLGDTPRDSLPLAALVGTSPDHWPSETAQWLERGYSTIKFKVGKDWRKELSALEAVRDAHPLVTVRLDANRNLNVVELTPTVDRLDALQIEFFEEPVATRELEEASELGFPIAVDESLRELNGKALSGLAERSLCALVLKPTVLGGLKKCVSLAHWARDRGVDVVVSHALEGPIARVAAAELALSLPSSLAAGLGPHVGLSAWPTLDAAVFEGAAIQAHFDGGLGLRSEVGDV